MLIGMKKKSVMLGSALVAVVHSYIAQVVVDVVAVSVGFRMYGESPALHMLPYEHVSAHTSAPSYHCRYSASPVDNSGKYSHLVHKSDTSLKETGRRSNHC